MKKFAFLLAMLVLAAPAMATVTVSCVVVDTTVTVSYASTEPNEIRAFALDITVNSGTITSVTAAKEGESTSASKGYGIFPGTIYIVDGDVCDWNTPVAPSGDPCAEGGIGTGGITVELGSLYEDGNAPLQPGPLPLLSFVMTDSSANVTIAENARRGGVVMKNPDETVATDGSGDVLLVLLGCGKVPVPNVLGDTRSVAHDKIEAAGLVVGTEDGAWNAAPRDDVLVQDPVGGTLVDPGSAVDLDLSAGPGPPADCMPAAGTGYDTQRGQWAAYVTALWDPTGWCGTPTTDGYQCHGDGDDARTGFPNYYRIYTGDLGLLMGNWKKKRVAYPGDGADPRADFDHKRTGFPNYFAVYTGDLARLMANWKATNGNFTPGGADCPLTDAVNNAAYVDPTPGVP